MDSRPFSFTASTVLHLVSGGCWKDIAAVREIHFRVVVAALSYSCCTLSLRECTLCRVCRHPVMLCSSPAPQSLQSLGYLPRSSQCRHWHTPDLMPTETPRSLCMPISLSLPLPQRIVSCCSASMNQFQ